MVKQNNNLKRNRQADRMANLKDRQGTSEISMLPLVTINSPLTQHGIHSVRADHYQQGLLATEHYIQRGHRAIGFLCVTAEEWGARERLRGYKDAMAAAGLEIDPAWIQPTI